MTRRADFRARIYFWLVIPAFDRYAPAATSSRRIRSPTGLPPAAPLRQANTRGGRTAGALSCAHACRPAASYL